MPLYRIKTNSGWCGLERPPFINWQDAADEQRKVEESGVESWIEPVTY